LSSCSELGFARVCGNINKNAIKVRKLYKLKDMFGLNFIKYFSIVPS